MNERPRQYATAAAFRVALETRLKSVAAAEGVDLQRLRRQVSFDRLLARFFVEPNAPWLLKGGYAMELRLRTARTTKDIDISLPADLAAGFAGEILARLQQSARADLGDFFGFTIAEPTMNLDAAPQGGARYPVTTMLAGRVFTRFQLDIGIGDAVVPPTELIEGRDWLGFAGIAPGRFMVISKEQQCSDADGLSSTVRNCRNLFSCHGNWSHQSNGIPIRIADEGSLDYLNACARLGTQRDQVELLVELSHCEGYV